MNYWEQFGLSRNPYSILPLLEGGEVALNDAFIGRKRESKFIHNLFVSEERICLTICGEIGTGKTSIANYIKYYWKYEEKEKPLFSFRREIEASETILDKNSFILEIIGSTLREIEILEPLLLKRYPLLKKLNQLVDVTQTAGLSGSISASLFGITLQSNVAERQMVQPLKLTTAALEKEFCALMKFIIKHKIAGKQYKGLIVHVNNFEIAIKNNKPKVMRFFTEIRDFLQTPGVYFLFLGPTTFFTDIIAKDNRVRSTFAQSPIMIKPLSKTELIKALHKRVHLLKSPKTKHIIQPFDEEVIAELYDLFSGDSRMVMAALQDIVAGSERRLPKTLGIDEALLLLSKERLSKLESQLTAEQIKVLAFIVASDRFITQNEIAKTLKKSPTNVSNYYFKPLIEYNIIEVKEVSGRNKFWGLTKYYLPLKLLLRSQRNLVRQVTEQVEELSR